jgi:hypothetical protein
MIAKEKRFTFDSDMIRPSFRFRTPRCIIRVLQYSFRPSRFSTPFKEMAPARKSRGRSLRDFRCSRVR